MIESILDHEPDAAVYVLAMDQPTVDLLKEHYWQKLSDVITLSEFENAELVRAKTGRSKAEYCWTCTPSLIHFCIKKYGMELCTYVDADLFFYRKPSEVVGRMACGATLITPHRYSEKYDQSRECGIYCVQFMPFRSSEEGMAILNDWRQKCLEWCFAHKAPGRFGDQKYLDEWTKEFDGVHVEEGVDVGIAPWNIQQYSFTLDRDCDGMRIFKNSVKVDPVFYHFHALKFYGDGTVDYGTNYKIPQEAFSLFYKSYINKIRIKLRSLSAISNSVGCAAFTRRPRGVKEKLKYIFWALRGTLNLAKF